MDNAMTSNDKFNEWAKEYFGVSVTTLKLVVGRYPEYYSDRKHRRVDYETEFCMRAAKAAWDARGKYDV